MKIKPWVVIILGYISVINGISAQTKKNPFILDMVHNNPGEPLTVTVFNDPVFLKKNGYTGRIVNEFIFAHAAITFKKFDSTLFPKDSKEYLWIVEAQKAVRKNIAEAKKAGIKVYYFTDIIVLPKKIVERYKNEICDANGKISFEKPKTLEIHRLMLDEVFETFPDLDGLVIRTGETYLNNVPYHTGNNPITNGASSHIKLINLLREEVCVKYNKMVFYRTWSFGGMHDNLNYYLDVTDKITPHPNLIFSIKHTKGDYHRTYDFNPTLGHGKHKQIVEVECQREYEGKGAYPDYVMEGVINGFEEYNTNTPQTGFTCLNNIKNNPQFAGVWSWSRGGGWVGPYIKNEFWCKLNAFVINNWGSNTKQSEEAIFNQFMDKEGIKGESRKYLRELCLLSAKAVIRGHSSVKYPVDKDMVFWMRDHFLGGIDTVMPSEGRFSSEGLLRHAFDVWYQKGVLEYAVAEKDEAVAIWENMFNLSKKIELPNKTDEAYIRTSTEYGLLLHKIIASGWGVMALGYVGDSTHHYDTSNIRKLIETYDDNWKKYKAFCKYNPTSGTPYIPYAFINQAPTYHFKRGMAASVNKYRKLVKLNAPVDNMDDDFTN